MFFSDGDEKLRATFGVFAPRVGLILRDGQARTRVALGVGPGGVAELAFYDENGNQVSRAP